MNRRRWKQIESDVALALGGQRVPITGRGRGSAPDVEHPSLSIEVKAGRVMSPRLREGMKQAVAAARDGKLPVLVIVQSLVKGEGGGKVGGQSSERYVMLRFEDFVRRVKQP
jgi:hypothetical protein